MEAGSMTWQPQTFQPINQGWQPSSFTPERPPDETGFLQRTGEDLKKRAQMSDDIRKAYQEGKITGPETGLQLAGGVLAGSVGDITGNAIVSGLESVNDLTGGYVGDALSSAVDRGLSVPVGTSGRTLGQRLSSVAGGGETAYNKVAEKFPRLTNNIEAAANLALIGVPAVKSGKSLLKSGKDLGAAFKKTPIYTSDEIRSRAGDLYKLASQQGGDLKPQFMAEYLRGVGAKAETDPFVKAVLAKGGSKDAYGEMLDIGADYAGQPMTFERARALDETLGRLAYENTDDFGKLNATGRQYQDMQKTLLSMIEEAPENMFVGGKQGFETAQEAKKYWSTQARLREVERIKEKAQYTAQPSTTVKTGMKNILTRGDKAKGYTPKELALVERAATTGPLTGLLNVFGSGLGPIGVGTAGFATGGPAGSLAAIPAYAIQKTAKAAAEKIQLGKADNVLREISKRVSPDNVTTTTQKAKLMANLLRDKGAVTAPLAISNATNTYMDNVLQDYARKKSVARLLRQGDEQ